MESLDEQLRALTPKQRAFVAAYCGVARFRADKAAKEAGYSERTAKEIGYQLKSRPEIRACIDAMLAANTLNSAEILHELTDVGMRRLDEMVNIIAYDKEGNPLAAKMDASAKMKALELLGKHNQLFSENLNIHGGIEIREYAGIPEDVP